MSVSYFVRYEGQAASPREFPVHYPDRHVPLPARFARVRRVLLHTPTVWQDAYPIRPDTLAIGSQARAGTRNDFAQMPPFPGVVYRTAAVSEEVFPQ